MFGETRQIVKFCAFYYMTLLLQKTAWGGGREVQEGGKARKLMAESC